MIVPIYEAHFTDGSASWCEVIQDQRDELARDGAAVRNPEVEELEENANEFAAENRNGSR